MAISTIGQEGLSSSAQYIGFKNRIINGDMRIDQRNAGAAVSTQGYLVDRWRTWFDQSYSFQQVADAPAGYKYSLKVTKTSATASTYGFLLQYIEGQNVVDLSFGSSTATAVTLSFWVKSSINGIFTASLTNSAENRAYLATYTINAVNTWEYKTVTIPGDMSGAWSTDSGKGVTVQFDFAGANPTYAAGSWVAANPVRATGTTNIGTTNNATFQITGVQLEKGSVATAFDYRPFGTELQLCQRYYYQHITGDQQVICNVMYYTAAAIYGVVTLPVSMRTAPSLVSNTGTNYYFVESGGASDFMNSIFILKTGSANTCGIGNNSEAGGTNGYSGWLASNNAATRVGFSAEL